MAENKSKLMDEWNLIRVSSLDNTDSIEFPELNDEFWNETEAEYADKLSISKMHVNSIDFKWNKIQE